MPTKKAVEKSQSLILSVCVCVKKYVCDLFNVNMHTMFLYMYIVDFFFNVEEHSSHFSKQNPTSFQTFQEVREVSK